MRIKFAMMLVLAALGVMAGCGGDETTCAADANQGCFVPAGKYTIEHLYDYTGDAFPKDDFTFYNVDWEIKEKEIPCDAHAQPVIIVDLLAKGTSSVFNATQLGNCALAGAKLYLQVIGTPNGPWAEDHAKLMVMCSPEGITPPQGAVEKSIDVGILIRPYIYQGGS